ncbi:MFS transporter [Micromonospora zhanjiangensis]|uniref:MFS transporter n=1 Tax=Micromonospora zhanjiangensis TaxID=1522057 RepID=A0ABV8KM48_9ACTN
MVSDQTGARERPATFGEVFGQAEYRAIFASSTLSWLGDYIAKAAVTALVYQETRSVGLSAAAFALSYLPWLLGGPFLAALAERYPYRTVMIICDLARMTLIALLAVLDLSVWMVLGLLFLTTLANSPSQAVRSALIPLVLTGDRLVVGLSVQASTAQVAQVAGYAAGGTIAAWNPMVALLINAASFALSALILTFGVHRRPSASHRAPDSHLLHEIGEGFTIVLGNPVLRAVAIVVWTSVLFAIVPEGLAAGWAGKYGADSAQRGVAQALLMAANPVGFIIGGLLISRLVRPGVRQALVRPFLVLSPLVLVPALLGPHPAVMALLSAVCGFLVAGILPVANGLFVQALPNGYRARAFSVVSTGLQVAQGGAVLVTGALASHFALPRVVGLWSLAGVLLMLLVAARWPTPDQFNAAIAAAVDRNQSGPRVPPGPPATPGPRDRPAPARPNGTSEPTTNPQAGARTV